jgi:hypothetical protein
MPIIIPGAVCPLCRHLPRPRPDRQLPEFITGTLDAPELAVGRFLKHAGSRNNSHYTAPSIAFGTYIKSHSTLDSHDAAVLRALRFLNSPQRLKATDELDGVSELGLFRVDLQDMWTEESQALAVATALWNRIPKFYTRYSSRANCAVICRNAPGLYVAVCLRGDYNGFGAKTTLFDNRIQDQEHKVQWASREKFLARVLTYMADKHTTDMEQDPEETKTPIDGADGAADGSTARVETSPPIPTPLDPSGPLRSATTTKQSGSDKPKRRTRGAKGTAKEGTVKAVDSEVTRKKRMTTTTNTTRKPTEGREKKGAKKGTMKGTMKGPIGGTKSGPKKGTKKWTTKGTTGRSKKGTKKRSKKGTKRGAKEWAKEEAKEGTTAGDEEKELGDETKFDFSEADWCLLLGDSIKAGYNPTPDDIDRVIGNIVVACDNVDFQKYLSRQIALKIKQGERKDNVSHPTLIRVRTVCLLHCVSRPLCCLQTPVPNRRSTCFSS